MCYLTVAVGQSSAGLDGLLLQGPPAASKCPPGLGVLLESHVVVGRTHFLAPVQPTKAHLQRRQELAIPFFKRAHLIRSGPPRIVSIFDELKLNLLVT